ncbi:MAG: hypothetical protein ABI808_07310 [Pseudonocardiales bacterium]
MIALRWHRAEWTIIPALVIAFIAGATTGVTFAAYTGTASSGGPSISTKRVFPGTRTTAAFSINDRSGGGTVNDNASPYVAAGDGNLSVTGNWITTFAATRYLDFVYNAPLPGGIPVSGAAFNFTFLSSGAGTACFYFDVRAPVTGTVLATHGSVAVPLTCATSAGTTLSTPLPELTTSYLANGVTVRVYEKHSASTTSTTDVATVTGTGYAPFTLYPASYSDASTTVATTTPWGLEAADSIPYQSQQNWANNFNASRYMDFVFPAYVPAVAVVTGATFTHTYKDLNGITDCYYIDVIVSGAVVATHGSAAAPYCNNTGSYATDTIPLPEINTPAEANGITVRMYAKNGGGARRSNEDAATLGTAYYLD